MNLITVAIVAAISRLTESTISDIYVALKQRLSKKFGKDSELLRSVDALEANPNSKGRQQVLDEEVRKTGADKDDEIKQLAQRIMSTLEGYEAGTQRGTTIQYVEGNKNAIAGSFGTATVNITSHTDNK